MSSKETHLAERDAYDNALRIVQRWLDSDDTPDALVNELVALINGADDAADGEP